MHYLYWDMSDEREPSYTKIVRARYNTLKEAREQANSMIKQGYRVVCIEESKKKLGGGSRAKLERGKEVWKPGKA